MNSKKKKCHISSPSHLPTQTTCHPKNSAGEGASIATPATDLAVARKSPTLCAPDRGILVGNSRSVGSHSMSHPGCFNRDPKMSWFMKYNPHMAGYHNSQKKTKNQGFFIAHLDLQLFDAREMFPKKILPNGGFQWMVVIYHGRGRKKSPP